MAARDNNLSKMMAHHDWWAATYDFEILQGMALYNRITLDNIRRFLPKDNDALILDAGGGTGIWAVQIAQMGYPVVLTDISTGMLQKAREKVAALKLDDRVEIRHSDIRDMPEFEDGRFGMVVCQGDPLSYCGDHRAAVCEFARVVRRGGAVIASVDSRASAVSCVTNSENLDDVTRLVETGEVTLPHEREEFRYTIHAFTAEELRSLFESSGLRVERIIGKPAIARRLAAYNSPDPAVQEWLYQLELKYCDDPAFYPLAPHIEIAGRRM